MGKAARRRCAMTVTGEALCAQLLKEARQWRDAGSNPNARFANLYRDELAESVRIPLPMPKGPRPPLQVRGEGEGRHPMMMMSEIGAMWDGVMTEEEFLE